MEKRNNVECSLINVSWHFTSDEILKLIAHNSNAFIDVDMDKIGSIAHAGSKIIFNIDKKVINDSFVYVNASMEVSIEFSTFRQWLSNKLDVLPERIDIFFYDMVTVSVYMSHNEFDKRFNCVEEDNGDYLQNSSKQKTFIERLLNRMFPSLQ